MNIRRGKPVKNTDGTSTWIETLKDPEGVYTRTVTSTEWSLERTNCYCCSCTPEGSNDPYCRNHGFAGERPCETHSMPGKEDEEGYMPRSVQAQRARMEGNPVGY